ncbi:MAG: hypothetical protein B6I24_10610 [Bacteroidetes bacterium 4572_128]|nr:MAG: hypothetical protein B6I24_10610 [Bacteroidetes bacterium 4572_128]
MKTILLKPDIYYHIYNRANGSENLFLNENNYLFFLQKYTLYISPIAHTLAYCLMPNHIHFAIQIKSYQLLESFKLSKSSKNYSTIEMFISKQFSNLFSSYTQSFNKQQNRKGSLFMSNFKRKEISDENYFKQLIHYIHFNPVHHGFVKDLRDWKFSSFEAFFSEKSSKISREKVISWFGDKKQFWEFHKKQIENKMCLTTFQKFETFGKLNK